MILEIKDLCFESLSTALPLSLIIKGGEVKQLQLPACEAQKLSHVIMGLSPITNGYISFDGEIITPLSAETLRKYIAYVPQTIRWPDEKKNQTPPLEMHRLLLERAVSDQKPIAIVESIQTEDDITLCQKMADAGTAVLIILPPHSDQIHPLT